MSNSSDPLTTGLPARGGLTDVEGIKVGHYTERERPTGCTVILCENGAVGGVDVRGGAPGTRETDVLNPLSAVQQVHAIVLSGGSTFGLDTACGVMRYLDEHGIGFGVGHRGEVPAVPAAILFDLHLGDAKIRPTAQSGYEACVAARADQITEGSVGAGAGATVGKLFGPQFAMKGGLGTTSIHIGNTGVVVAALVAVNSVGDIFDPGTGRILAGARSPDSDGFANSIEKIIRGDSFVLPSGVTSTTIGVVATNAFLNKGGATKMAQMAHDGLARTINPVHTPFDGDTIFALATGTLKSEILAGSVGAVAAEAMAQAVLRAIKQAESSFGVLSYRDLREKQQR